VVVGEVLAGDLLHRNGGTTRRRPVAASRQSWRARLFGDDVSWIAARHSSGPVCTPTAIDIIEISVADGAAECGHELACGRGALLLLG
jgi:hypothetical protein